MHWQAFRIIRNMAMQIERRYHFYAAHRNLGLKDKCARLHGHRYGVAVILRLPYGNSGITMKFEMIDQQLKPIFARLDHMTLLDESDPLANILGKEQSILFGFPTSAENLAAYLLHQCRHVIPYCSELRLQETDSATIYVDANDLLEYPRR